MDLKAVQKLAKRNALYPAMPEDGVYHARPVELGDFVFGQTPVSEVLGADQRDVSRWVRHWMAEKTVERMAERGPGRAAVYRFIGATA